MYRLFELADKHKEYTLPLQAIPFSPESKKDNTNNLILVAENKTGYRKKVYSVRGHRARYAIVYVNSDSSVTCSRHRISKCEHRYAVLKHEGVTAEQYMARKNGIQLDKNDNVVGFVPIPEFVLRRPHSRARVPVPKYLRTLIDKPDKECDEYKFDPDPPKILKPLNTKCVKCKQSMTNDFNLTRKTAKVYTEHNSYLVEIHMHRCSKCKTKPFNDKLFTQKNILKDLNYRERFRCYSPLCDREQK